MLRIKKLDIFVLKSFCTLFIGTFFICLFIFMMQFLWRYVDELIGKGLEMTVMAQFFFYSALTLVPVSLPLAVLLAALITFGNFGERFELLAMKAAGISLLKIMRPLIIFIVFICCLSFYFQNVIGPKAQTDLGTLLISMKQKAPELDIPEGVFYDEIDGYNLYVKRKNRDTGMLYDVLIYNFEKGFENAQIIKADSGRLEMTADKKHLYLHLYSGEQFENLKSQSMDQRNVPYRREAFREKHAIIEFDSDFNMVDAGIMSNYSNSKNMKKLQMDIDSMQVQNDSLARVYYEEAMQGTYRVMAGMTKEDTLKIEKAHLGEYNVDSIFNMATLVEKQKIISTAIGRAEGAGSDWSFKSNDISMTENNLRRHMTSWHEKLTLSLACLIFFFIGAPLGGIIRKGGLGMPVVVSVFIFIVYYIINNTGYKMARDGKWIVWMGMWTSTAVLAPLGAFLTYKSNNDSVVLNADAYINWFKRVVGIRNVRHLFRKEVIIHDPDYVRIPGDLRALSVDCRAYAEKKALKRAPNYFKLWMAGNRDEVMEKINERLETLIDEMSNTKSITLLTELNNYPIIPVHAHVRPFRSYWLNLLCGVLFPIGLFFYFRIWIFRIRLNKDMERIIKTNEEVIAIIENRENR
ncbi:LptF/LptG family permease [Bacteroides heparinolyticus]|uniref:LptF/LptG family permease n=2 Tax=Prevotella heparinolytica TaxID=28113 RepID=A0A3P2A692_9BACE|nr:LptF/LptG family permease [Bacteroides heparinolyticus]MCI6211743.1 LptF/LptG family permease [Bacteroides heparinolyticus]RRD89173.1 LptF/LptG family permease [Bacteroides heparinolyticus]VFB14451.1 permease YjgP/YjgQ family protein [Bacteroides heparinolyticus]